MQKFYVLLTGVNVVQFGRCSENSVSAGTEIFDTAEAMDARLTALRDACNDPENLLRLVYADQPNVVGLNEV